jgi:oxygen-independent coproporphyrinogen-3 oxidase
MDWSRKYGFQSRSVDLIYGLPKQTPETFKETIDIILEMSPDRLSVYNYAHLPHIFKPQRRILETDLPLAADKLDILSNTIEGLGEAGYVFIGMDHFARPDDELAIAQKEGKLHRNFQGYSTQAECDLLAFGISSIGKVDDCYSQNVRTLDEYYAAIDAGYLPTLRGLQLNADDLMRRDLIGELMCQFSLDTKVFGALHKIDFESYFQIELAELKELEGAGLLEWHGANLVVPMKGRLLARRVAMSFDRHLRESKAKGTYSKVL